jgi:hypothetical protein
MLIFNIFREGGETELRWRLMALAFILDKMIGLLTRKLGLEEV